MYRSGTGGSRFIFFRTFLLSITIRNTYIASVSGHCVVNRFIEIGSDQFQYQQASKSVYLS